MRISDWSSDVCSSDLRQSCRSTIDNEPPNGISVRLGFGPDHHDIRDRRVGDPCLRAGQPIAPANSLGLGPHRARNGAGIRLSKAQAAYTFAEYRLGKKTMTQVGAAEGDKDRKN